MTEIVVTNPQLKKVVEWLEQRNPLMKSFLATVALFLVIGVIGGIFVGAYLLGGTILSGSVGVFLLAWLFMLREFIEE